MIGLYALLGAFPACAGEKNPQGLRSVDCMCAVQPPLYAVAAGEAFAASGLTE